MILQIIFFYNPYLCIVFYANSNIMPPPPPFLFSVGTPNTIPPPPPPAPLLTPGLGIELSVIGNDDGNPAAPAP